MEPTPGRLRLGLCCILESATLRFRHTNARILSGKPPAERLPALRAIGLHNARALEEAVGWCADHGILAFRVQNDLLPLKTHPEHGWAWDALDPGGEIRGAYAAAGRLAAERDVRLSMHPDQFIVLGSARPEVVDAGVAELDFLGEFAAILGAEQLTIHGGGAVGGKPAALERLARGIGRLSPLARERIVLENDDRTYTVADLLPIARAEGVPLVYDVHHHRCNPDELTVEEATRAAVATWGGREAWAHVSSPRDGWGSDKPEPHSDFIDATDVPDAWRGLALTVDVEAKAKEAAVLRLGGELAARGWACTPDAVAAAARADVA